MFSLIFFRWLLEDFLKRLAQLISDIRLFEIWFVSKRPSLQRDFFGSLFGGGAVSCRVIMGLLEARLRISASLEYIEYCENGMMNSAVDSYSLEFIVHIFIMTKIFPRGDRIKPPLRGVSSLFYVLFFHCSKLVVFRFLKL